MSVSGKELLEKVNQLETKSNRSVLDEYFESIVAMRKKNWTYAQIAQFLSENGIQVSEAWLNRYFLTRMSSAKRVIARRKKRKQVLLNSAPVEPKPMPQVLQKDPTSEVKKPKFSFESFTKDGF